MPKVNKKHGYINGQRETFFPLPLVVFEDSWGNINEWFVRKRYHKGKTER